MNYNVSPDLTITVEVIKLLHPRFNLLSDSTVGVRINVSLFEDIPAPSLLLDLIREIWYAVVEMQYYMSVRFQGARNINYQSWQV